MACTRLSIMTVMPKVTNSELNGEISNRASTHCMAAPSTKNTGGMMISVSSGSMPHTVAMW